MSEVAIPETPIGIDADWLNEALVGWPTVASVSHEDIGEGTGIFGQISRLTVDYDDNADGSPTRMVVKMACLEPANLAIAPLFQCHIEPAIRPLATTAFNGFEAGATIIQLHAFK